MASPERVVLAQPLQLLALRYLPGGAQPLAAALQAVGIEQLPSPGQVLGQDPALLWSRPSEYLLLSAPGQCHDEARSDTTFSRLCTTLAPRPGALAAAVDLSHGHRLLSCEDPQATHWMARLADAQALPRAAALGHGADSGNGASSGSWLRMADLRVFVWCLAPAHYRLLVDATAEQYLLAWLAYAGEALDDERQAAEH